MTDRAPDDDSLARHLVASGLAGHVATSVGNCLDNIGRLLAGRPGYTFGLSDWVDAAFDEVVAAVVAAGGNPQDTGGGRDGPAFIDPAAAVRAIARHREALTDLRARGAGRVLVATGHPFALLGHYAAVARDLESAGITVLRPLEGGARLTAADGRPCSLRYVEGVACLFQDVALQHTHYPDYMQAMLAAIDGPAGADLVVAAHGYAGASIEAGIPTLAIADVNDPALPLAQFRGRTDGVLVIDDGLDASHFVPVTRALLGRALNQSGEGADPVDPAGA